MVSRSTSLKLQLHVELVGELVVESIDRNTLNVVSITPKIDRNE